MNNDLISRSELKKHKFTTQTANGVELVDIEVVPLCVIDNAQTVLTIPNTPTNGDMIKVLFPDGKICRTNDHEIGIRFKGDNWVIWFKERWWNALYGKEEEDREWVR